MTTLAPTRRSTELLSLIEQHRSELDSVLRRYGVTNVRLFGSVVRGEAEEHSDIDLLFTRPEGMRLFSIVGLGQELSDLLGVSVDAVPGSVIKQHLRSDLERDAIPL